MLLEQENPDLAIVFCRTKRGAEKLAKRLHADGIECREIHGNLAQNKRDRVMKSFRSGKFDVLVATDLASRGIDVADISHIINYDIPEDPEVYVHRVGRTARMGAEGKAFTFVSRDQGDELTQGRSADQHGDPAGDAGRVSSRIPHAGRLGRPLRRHPIRAEQADRQPLRAPVRRDRGQCRTAAASAPAPPSSLPPRTIGSKIPINRRHKRRR